MATATETTIITADLLTEEAAVAMEPCEEQAQVSAIRWRFDRQLMLLRMVPEGWQVERSAAPQGGEVYTATGPDGRSVWAHRRRDSAVTGGPGWRGTAQAGMAMAVVCGLAALDAEARS